MSQEKEINYIQTISVCRWQHPIYRKTLKKKTSPKNCWIKMNCVKLQDTKPTYKNQLFLYSKNELSTKEIKKKILLIIASKIIKCLGIMLIKDI